MRGFIVLSSAVFVYCQNIWWREVLILFQILNSEFKLSCGSDAKYSLTPEDIVFELKVVY